MYLNKYYLMNSKSLTWLTVTLDVFKLDKLLKLYDELERLTVTLDVFK